MCSSNDLERRFGGPPFVVSAVGSATKSAMSSINPPCTSSCPFSLPQVAIWRIVPFVLVGGAASSFSEALSSSEGVFCSNVIFLEGVNGWTLIGGGGGARDTAVVVAVHNDVSIGLLHVCKCGYLCRPGYWMQAQYLCWQAQ